MPRKRYSEMSLEELMAEDARTSYEHGRADAFDHGKPETVLRYWEQQEPSDDELRIIVKNLLERMVE